MSSSNWDSVRQQANLLWQRACHYINHATSAAVDHLCISMPILHLQGLPEIVDLIQANQFSKLIGIYRCALIQVLFKEVTENTSPKKVVFDALCAKYNGYRLQQVLLTELFDFSQASSSQSDESTQKVIYVPKIPFMDDFLDFFHDINFDELFEPVSFSSQPSLVVRIKRVYNLMLKLERCLLLIEEDRLGGNLYAVSQQFQELITDLYHLDIDFLALMTAQISGVNEIGDVLARLQMASENSSMFDLVQWFLSKEQGALIGGKCGFWLGLLLSQSHEKYQSLSTIAKFGDELNQSINMISDACVDWVDDLSCNLALRSIYAEDEMVQNLQLKVKEILTQDEKVAGFMTALFSQDFISAFKEYQKKFNHHLHSFLPSLKIPNLGLLNLFNLNKLHQLISLIKLIYQHVSEFKEHTKTLQNKYNDMLLLLLFHLKYDLMLSMICYADVFHHSAFLKSGSMDSGIGPIDMLEIFLQHLYGKIISVVGKVCDFSQNQSLEVLFDEDWIAKRQELAINNMAFLYADDLELQIKQMQFYNFRELLLLNTQLDFELQEYPEERKRFIQSFVVAYPLVNKYYPDIADRIRHSLQNSTNLSLDSVEYMTQIDEHIAQCIEHNVLQQKALTVFLTELSDLNKSGLFFLELQADKFVNHEHLFTIMKSNYAIFKLDNYYYFLNQSAKKAYLIPQANYAQLARVCQKFFNKHGVLFRFKANDCQTILNLLLEQSPHLLEGHHDFSMGIHRVGDAPKITHTLIEEDNDYSHLSEEEILNAYVANQAKLRQFNFHYDYIEKCCQTLANLSKNVSRLDRLEAKDYADLIHLFVTAKPVLKLAYKEKEWIQMVDDIQVTKNILLANLKLNIEAKLSGILQFRTELEDRQQEIKEAYQLKVAERGSLAENLASIKPDQRLGKLIRHDNYSKLISELMHQFRTALRPFFCRDVQEALRLNGDEEPYPLIGQLNSVYKLPKQVADLIWFYNSLYYLREFILELEEATGSEGYIYVLSQIQLIKKYFAFQNLFFFSRPSAQPAFYISSNMSSRILQSKWAFKEEWQTFYEQLHQLLLINGLARETSGSVQLRVEEKSIEQKHQMNTLVHWICSVPFLLTHYTEENVFTLEQTKFSDLKKRNLQIAKRIDDVLNPSWYFTLFELPNLAKSVLDVYAVIQETLSATKTLTYDHFKLIRAEIYKIYAVIEASEIDLGVKEGMFLHRAEHFLEAFTEELLAAIHLPLEKRASLLSRREGYEYRKPRLERELARLNIDGEELQLEKNRLEYFLHSTEAEQIEMFREIYPIIEAYRSVQMQPVDLSEVRFKTQAQKRQEILLQDEVFKQLYVANREQWGKEDGKPVPKDFEFPNHFLAFIQLVIDNMTGKIETIKLSEKIHIRRVQNLNIQLNAVNDKTTQHAMIAKYYECYKASLIDACVERFKDFPALKLKYMQILNQDFLEKSFLDKFIVQLEAQSFANVENVLSQSMIQHVEELDKVHRLNIEKKRMILEKIQYFDAYLDSLETNFVFVVTENASSIQTKRLILQFLQQELLNPDCNFEAFYRQIQTYYSALTSMGKAQTQTWMQVLIQSVVWLLECLGLIKSYRHSFFYALNDVTREDLQYDDIKPNISQCLV